MEPHPTIENSVLKVFWFTIGILIISWIMSLFNQEWRFIVPFLFVWLAIKPLLKRNLYGLKQKYSTKSDKRFSRGYKITGSSEVINKSVTEELTERDVYILRSEGILKLVILFIFLYRAYPLFAKSTTRPMANAKQDLVVAEKKWVPKLIKVGGESEVSEGPSFVISNRSKYHAYHRIYLNVYFYNNKGKLLDSTNVRVFETLKPGSSAVAGGLHISSIPVKSKSAKATINSAIDD